ncbi:MAG: sigma-70 family RNA polymerase sigma factor [Verrucomicrobiota bacterium]
MTDSKSPEADPGLWLNDHGDHLYGYAMYRLRDKHMAEDMVQETLLAAWKAYGKFEGRSSIKTWLTTILHNKIVDFVRKAARQKLVFSDEDLDGRIDGEFSETGHINAEFGSKQWPLRPDDMAQRGDFWRILQQCIDHLPKDTGEVFRLREVDGLSTEEICELKGIGKNNFWVILHRARKGLRSCMESNWVGQHDK